MNSLLLGLAIANKGKEIDQTLYLDIKDNEGTHFAALKTAGRHFIVSADSDKLSHFSDILFAFLQENEIRFPGVIGPKELVLGLQVEFQRVLGWESKIQFRQLVYRLDQVVSNPNIGGELRLVEEEESALFSEWLHLFYVEVFGEDDRNNSYQLAQAKIRKKEAYIWLDQSSVTMACIARPTPNGVTINYVYTPPGQRKKGYASMIVAELSQLQLRAGYKFCTLFTDLVNPASNSIYQKIGYQVVGEFRSIEFS